MGMANPRRESTAQHNVVEENTRHELLTPIFPQGYDISSHLVKTFHFVVRKPDLHMLGT